ncbi:MAG: hypothetical protein IPJ82_16060 [Lewinellaceae bacterium]|nr:hypothetical protein [Lewinellaceae bacterium]
MRIIGHIEHPEIKITVFKMENRISVKLENPLYEQTYKLEMDERINSLESVQLLIDENFIQQVLAQFRAMHQNRMSAFARVFPVGQGAIFEEII